MPSEIDHQKKALRTELRARRQALTATELEQATAGLTQNLIALVTKLEATSVTCYLSTPREPNTREFIAWAVQNDVTVLLPISREDGLMDWVRATADKDNEVRGLWNMPELTGDRLPARAAEDVDLLLTPGAAVDRQGMRLGWGRGYFDRTLASLRKVPPVYTIVFDSEILDSVPSEDHDHPVDGAVTPSTTLDFTRSATH